MHYILQLFPINMLFKDLHEAYQNKQRAYQRSLPALPMPNHLEEFKIEIDQELEKWEMEHEKEYKAIEPLTGSARLELCEGEGRRAALERQRANIVARLFPDVCYYSLLYKYF